MKLLDYIKILGLFVVCLMPLVVLVMAAMRYEQYRARRTLAIFAAGLETGRSRQVRGPGVWVLPELEGKRAGCDVALSPKVIGPGAMVDVGSAAPIRLKTMGYELIVRAPAAGPLGDHPPALTRALKACDTTLRVHDGEARADLEFPKRPADATRALALVDAIAAYLTGPAA